MDRVSDRSPTLFHYTTVEGFRGICETQQFWATHYSQMNDSSEFERFSLLAREFITPRIRNIFETRMQTDLPFAEQVHRDGGVDVVSDGEAAMQLDMIHHHTFGDRGFRETFVCSFCTHKAGSYEEEHGLLSQWRAYGTGGGVAIVLDTRGIEDRMHQEGQRFDHPINHLIDVCYDDKLDIIKQEFNEIFESFPTILHSLYRREPPPYEKIFEHFLHGSTAVKHRGFSEEAEIRLVVAPTPTNKQSAFYKEQKIRKPIRYRLRVNKEVRFIELFGDARLPITRVIVGPSQIQNFNYQTVEELAASSGIKVTRSETPFIR